MSERWKWIGLALLCLGCAAVLYQQWPYLRRTAALYTQDTPVAAMAVEAHPAAAGQVLDWADALIYLPSGLVPGETYPLVLTFAPDANARGMLDFWKVLAERHRFIVYSSKLYRNHTRMDLPQMKAYVDRALGELPANRRRVIFTGLSGGGSFSHLLNAHYPGLAYGLIINTGQFWESGHVVAEQNNARHGPMRTRVVLLASPTDFRLREMERDRALLTRWGATVKWIEFAGGHTLAPHAIYDEALAWLLRPGAGGARAATR